MHMFLKITEVETSLKRVFGDEVKYMCVVGMS
jgi:hypothetical protein